MLLLLAALAVLILAAYMAFTPRRGAAFAPQLRNGRRIKLAVAGLESGSIPRRYTCDGEDVSPPIEWVPLSGVSSYLLLVYDPDAPKGVFIHWVLYNIPSSVHSLPEGIPPAPLTRLGVQGVNDFHRLGYGGPCPPPGPEHHYHFLLVALDKRLDVRPGAAAEEVIRAAEGHVIGYGEVVLTYRRG